MSRQRRVAVALAGLCVLALSGAALSGAATAGDKNARITFEPDEATVQPGETVDVAVVLRSHGAYGDTGVARIDLRVDVPPAYLTVVDVEAGAWFEKAPEGSSEGSGPENVGVVTSVDSAPDAGAVQVSQRLRSLDEGVTGEARVATVTLRVAEDADPATVEVSAAETDVRLTSRYGQPVVAEPPAELDVAGGGETVEPPFPEQPFADEAVDGTTASATDEPGETAPAGSTAAGTTTGGSEGTAPEPVGAVVVGVGLGAWLFARRS